MDSNKNKGSLTGRRILVTRAAHQAGALSKELRALGAEPVEVPVLEIRPPESFNPLDAALHQLASYDWLILTSANAVHVLAERAHLLRISLQTEAPPQGSLTQPAWPKVAAVGEATAAAARKAGLQVAFVPESYVAESLVAGLIGHFQSAAQKLIPGSKKCQGTALAVPKMTQNEAGALAPEGCPPVDHPASFRPRILLARAAVARDVIPDALRAAGAAVDVVDAYRNAMPEAAPEQLRQALRNGLDAATFTSSSSATHLAEAARAAGVAWPLAGVPAVSIGPITSQTLRDLGWPPAAEANPFDIPGLIAAIESIFRH